MTGSTSTAPRDEVEARPSSCRIAWMMLRVAGSVAALVALYFLLPLDHTDGVYFTVTVFSTVGFGDITAKTETARLVVTGQMIADLVILGLAIKVIVGAISRGRQRRPQDADGVRPTRQIRS